MLAHDYLPCLQLVSLQRRSTCCRESSDAKWPGGILSLKAQYLRQYIYFIRQVCYCLTQLFINLLFILSRNLIL